MNSLVLKIANLILKLVNDLENDINYGSRTLKDKKTFTDLVNKLLPMIIKLEKIKSSDRDDLLNSKDLKIINEFLEKNRKVKVVAREGFEPPTNGL